jgi:hypothetical protein
LSTLKIWILITKGRKEMNKMFWTDGVEKLALRANVVSEAGSYWLHENRGGDFVRRLATANNGVIEFSGYAAKAIVACGCKGNPDALRVNDDQLSFELTRWPRLQGLRPFRVQTMQQPSEGTVYTYGSDFATARFLPGRNVVIVEAESLDGLRKAAAIMQVTDFHLWAASHAANMAAGLRGWEAFDSLCVDFRPADCPWVITVLRDDR